MGEGSIPQAINRRSQSPVALRRRESIRRLKEALAGDRLVVHYQPIMAFEIWLDDFGTGHSTLEWLWRLPIDGLKIPGTFVQDVTRDRKAATITAAIVELAHRLDVRIAAEGIETEDQRRWLAGQGCHELQGFLLYQPMPADELVQRLAG